MDNINQQQNNIERCYIKFEGGEADVFTANLNLAVGQFSSCTVQISEASPVFPNIDTMCALIIKLDGKLHYLFNGYIISDVQSVSTATTHIEGYRQYTIAILTESLDSTPPVAWTYLSNAVNTENGAVQGYVLVGNNIETNKSSALAKTALNTNIAEIIVDTVNQLQGTIRSSSISSLFTYDSTVLNMQGTHELSYYITEKATNLLKGGATYIQTIETLCNEFLLTLIPKLPSTGGYFKMHITYKPAWGRKPVTTIKLSDYLSILSTNVSIKNRQIDGIIMPYWDTRGSSVTNLGLYAFYGRQRLNSGYDFVITDHKSLEKYFGQTTSSLRYKQISLPSWLGKGLAVSSLQKAVKGYVKSYFSLYSYAQRKMSIDLPLVKFLDLTKYLGDLVSLQAFTEKVEGLDSGSTKTSNYYIGQLAGLSLHLNFIQSKLVVSCSANISHVRPERTDRILNFTASDLMYR